MPQLYPNTLLQYTFGELNYVAKNNFEHIILSNDVLQRQYFELDTLLHALKTPQIGTQPSASTLTNILKYA